MANKLQREEIFPAAQRVLETYEPPMPGIELTCSDQPQYMRVRFRAEWREGKPQTGADVFVSYPAVEDHGERVLHYGMTLLMDMTPSDFGPDPHAGYPARLVDSMAAAKALDPETPSHFPGES